MRGHRLWSVATSGLTGKNCRTEDYVSFKGFNDREGKSKEYSSFFSY